MSAHLVMVAIVVLLVIWVTAVAFLTSAAILGRRQDEHSDVEWAWRQRIPHRQLTLVGGRPEEGMGPYRVQDPDHADE